MARKTRLLFVIPSLLRAGAQTQLVDLVNSLDGERYERHVFAFEKRIDQAEQLDGDVRFHHRIRKGRFDFGPAREMARLIDSVGIDLVHCTMQFALLQGSIAVGLSQRRPPFVDALHTTVNRNLKDELLDRILYTHLMRRASGIICVCETQSHVWTKKFPFLSSKMHVVHNGVDAEHYRRESSAAHGSALRERLGISPTDPVVASVAAFRPEKAHHLLIPAIQHVLGSLPGAHLLLAGDGPLREAVEEDVRERGLKRCVHFLGSIEDVRPVLAASDVSVIASTAVETFSIAMLESLSMQVPVVSSDIGGSAEAVIDGHTGRIVPVGDSLALGNALTELLEDEDARRLMGERGRELVLSRFTRARMASQTDRVLQCLVSNACGCEPASTGTGAGVTGRTMGKSGGQ